MRQTWRSILLNTTDQTSEGINMESIYTNKSIKEAKTSGEKYSKCKQFGRLHKKKIILKNYKNNPDPFHVTFPPWPGITIALTYILQNHQDHSNFWYGSLDVTEMRPHAKHNYSKVVLFLNC